MPGRDALYLGSMLDTIEKALELLGDRGRGEYDGDEALRLAMAHLVQTIGEAARRVSDEARQRYPAVPWRQIVGMRHRIVHDYLDVDFGIVWQVVTADLPRLLPDLRKTVEAELRRQEEQG
jgi:uncharacterized protein with HEPN domain